MRAKIFKFIAGAAVKFPWVIVIVAVAIALVSGVLAAKTIKLNANLDELVSPKLDYHKRYINFLNEFGDEEYLYVVVDASKDLSASKKFLDSLALKLRGREDLEQIIWKLNNPALEKNFLLYMSPDELKVLAAMTTSGPFSVQNITQWDGFAPMFGALATRIGGPVSPSDEAELSTGFTFIDGLLDDMLASMERGAPYQTRLQALFFGNAETFDPDGYIKNGSLLFMLIMPSKDFSTMAVIDKPLKEIRKAIDDTKREFPGIDAGLTGRPVLSADEMASSNRDMTLATVIALALVSAIFILFFRGVSRPLCAVASLVIGISWTFGFVALAVGTLNILSSVFVLLLIGASIEYSVYIVSRYQEELAKSGDPGSAITRTLQTTGMANWTSAFTTAAAFCTLMWTDFTALAQLGAIAASGIILCLISMIVVLPSILIILDRRRTKATLKNIHSFLLPQMDVLYRRPSVLIAAVILVTVLLVPFARKVGFDNNLLNLQAKGLESVKYEHLIIAKSSETTWFARAVAGTIGESHALAESFRKLPSVRRVDDVEKILPEDQDKKIEMVKSLAPAFAELKFNEVGEVINSRMLMYELGRLASNLERLESQAFQSGRADAVEELGKFAGKVRQLVSSIAAADEIKIGNLGKMQAAFFNDLQTHISILASGMNPGKLSLNDLPSDIVGRFVSPKGRFALMIYPKENIWDPPALERFVKDVRGVDPKVIGTPIEVYESGRLMRGTFLRSAVLAFVLICLLVWLDFRTVRASVLAVIPLIFGMLWLLGAMGLIGLKFNMANFFAIPIIIGTGVDFGVQVVHRLRQERSFGALGTSTGRGLVMTAAANGIGFGALLIASHRGIASLGAILALGCLMCLVAALIATPPVARWLGWGHKVLS